MYYSDLFDRLDIDLLHAHLGPLDITDLLGRDRHFLQGHDLGMQLDVHLPVSVYHDEPPGVAHPDALNVQDMSPSWQGNGVVAVLVGGDPDPRMLYIDRGADNRFSSGRIECVSGQVDLTGFLRIHLAANDIKSVFHR